MKDNVTVQRGDGNPCCICGCSTPTGEPVVAVSFDVSVLVATVKVNKQMHLDCAVELGDTLILRARQAGRKSGGR
jgi:hypothetical protein